MEQRGKKARAGGRFILDPGNGKNLHIISLWEYAVFEEVECLINT